MRESAFCPVVFTCLILALLCSSGCGRHSSSKRAGATNPPAEDTGKARAVSSKPSASPSPAPISDAPDSTALLARLRIAPSVLEIGDARVVLDAYLWRDFMPVIGGDSKSGKPMMAVIKLAAAPGSTLPSGVDAQLVWLVRGTEIWAGSFMKEERTADPRAVEKVFRNGPLWPPGEAVDVIVEVLDAAGGKHLLRASGVKIHQTS